MAILALDDLLALRVDWHQRRLRLVLTNGVFDMLHAGHVSYLERARAMGDLLIIALNSDHSTRLIKGPLRPIIPAEDRATLLAALRAVDYVTIFDQPTAEAVILALRPDLYVKGADYGTGPDGAPDPARLPEARVVSAYGGQVALLPFAEGRSTSALIDRIVQRYGQASAGPANRI